MKQTPAWYPEAMKVDSFDTLNGKPTSLPPPLQKR